MMMIFALLSVFSLIRHPQHEFEAYRAQLKSQGYDWNTALWMADGLVTHYEFGLDRNQALRRLLVGTPLESRLSTPPETWHPEVAESALYVNHYTSLGVTPNASPEAIAEAHRTGIEALADTADTEDRRHALDVAIEVLGDPNRRLDYDYAILGLPFSVADPEYAAATSGKSVWLQRAPVLFGVLVMLIMGGNIIHEGYKDWSYVRLHDPARYKAAALAAQPVPVPVTASRFEPPPPTCHIRFKPYVIRVGERSLQCYEYTGPVHLKISSGSGILSYLGRVVDDNRNTQQNIPPDERRYDEGYSQCGWIKPSRKGIGGSRFELEGPGGKTSCAATLTVVPTLPPGMR
jgi:hypothetical protein